MTRLHRFVYPLVSLFTTLLLLVFGLSISFAVHRLPDVNQPEVKKEVWIYSGHPVSQTITPIHNGLNLIYVYLRNVSLRNQLPFVFTLSDASGTLLRRIDITGYNIIDGDNVRFQFSPITDSAGKTYTLKLSSPESTLQNAVGVGFIPRDLYVGGKSTVSGEAEGDIAFSAFYYPENPGLVVTNSFKYLLNSLSSPRLILLFSVFTILGGIIVRTLFLREK